MLPARMRIAVTTLFVAVTLGASLAAASPATARRTAYRYRVPGGGHLIVPRTSITDGARIVIRRARGPRVPEQQRALGRAVSLGVRRGRLVGPVTLVLPYNGGATVQGMPARLSVSLAYYD